MNRPSDTRSSSKNLPSFLGPDANETPEEQGMALDGDCAATHHEDGESEDMGEESYGADGKNAYDAPEASAPRTTRRRSQFHSVKLAGGLGMMFGATLTITGLVTAALPAATAILAAVIAPQMITLVGLTVFAIATSQRRTSRLQRRLQALETDRNSADDEFRDTLAQILHGQDSQEMHAADDDTQQLMLSLQRQDQKINNLTKAIKMYGKPLMELAGQGTELAGSIAHVKALIEGAAESTRQHVNRVEDATTQLATQLEMLQRGDNVKAATTELQQSLGHATTGLKKGLDQIRQGNLAGLETSVKDIQRDLAGLATAMSQVQAAINSGAHVAANASQAAHVAANASQAAPVQAAASATATPPSSANTSNHAAPPASADDNDASGYTTGERKSGGINVLGAIAKLKRMKS